LAATGKRHIEVVSDESIRCPGCGQVVEVDAAVEQGEQDDAAPLTCPTCGAGFTHGGELVHDPAIGP
jgi:transcription elongation factor Elf1